MRFVHADRDEDAGGGGAVATGIAEPGTVGRVPSFGDAAAGGGAASTGGGKVPILLCSPRCVEKV